MIPIVSILVILTLSMIVTRIASVALEHTGLSRDAARFQARSAFTGVGFTTSESEGIVGHPVRRRIVALLMLVGNVGIVTAMSSVVLSFIDLGRGVSLAWQVGTLVGGILTLWLFASSRWVDQRLSAAIRWALRRFTHLDVQDFASLLRLRDDYGIHEFVLQESDWVTGRTLREIRLADEGVVVLGIECPRHSFVGAPPADTVLRTHDRLIVYGPNARIRELADRREGRQGDVIHAIAKDESRGRRDAEVSQREARAAETAVSGEPVETDGEA